MRLAIIADTHGNLVALETVLADIAAAGVDGGVCLGDVAGLGSKPRAVMARLQDLGWPMVLGNADLFLLEPWRLDPANNPDAAPNILRLHEMEKWVADQLTEADRDFLRTFQPTVEVALPGGGSLLGYHGGPRSAWDEIRGATPPADLIERLGPAESRHRVMAGGHTHEQIYRRLDETIVLNPGSVGLPYERLPGGGYRNPPWAEYAILTATDTGHLAVELRRVPLDTAAIRADLLASGAPHAADWAADWR